MSEIRSRVVNCQACNELVSSRRQAVPGDGSIPAKILFVGLAPGRNGADITGVPFTRDPSGLLFREMVEKAMICDFYVTNIVKCNPQDSKGRNRTPTPQEINNCSVHLKAELLLVEPKVIVPLGKQATEIFLGKISNMTSAKLRNVTVNKKVVLPMLHPSYVIRGAYTKKDYYDDFIKLRNLVNG